MSYLEDEILRVVRENKYVTELVLGKSDKLEIKLEENTCLLKSVLDEIKSLREEIKSLREENKWVLFSFHFFFFNTVLLY